MGLGNWRSPEYTAWRAHLLAQQRPVVLMGRGHSGTRVLAWICVQLGVQLGQAAVFGAGDAADRAFTQRIKKLACTNLHVYTPEQVKASDLRRFQHAVYTYYVRLGCPRALWGWKFPETYLIAPYVARTFPQARYIHIIRDGRDIAFKHHLTDDPQRRLGRRLLVALGALDLPHHLQAAVSWAFQVRKFQRFCRALAPQQLFELRFEDLCLAPEAVVQDLCTFLDVPFPETCRAALRTFIDPSKVAQYRAQDPLLVHEVETSVGETLQHYGYL